MVIRRNLRGIDGAGRGVVGAGKRLNKLSILVDGAEDRVATGESELLAVVDVADLGRTRNTRKRSPELHLDEGSIRSPDTVPSADGIEERHDRGIVSGEKAEDGLSLLGGGVESHIAEVAQNIIVSTTHGERSVSDAIRIVVSVLVLELHGRDDLLVEIVRQVTGKRELVALVGREAVESGDGRDHAVSRDAVVLRELGHQGSEGGRDVTSVGSRLLRIRLVLGELRAVSRVGVQPLTSSIDSVDIDKVGVGSRLSGPRVHTTQQGLSGLKSTRNISRTQVERRADELEGQQTAVLLLEISSIDEMLIVTILGQLSGHARSRDDVIAIEIVLTVETRNKAASIKSRDGSLLNLQIAIPDIVVVPATVNRKTITVTDENYIIG